MVLPYNNNKLVSKRRSLEPKALAERLQISVRRAYIISLIKTFFLVILLDRCKVSCAQKEDGKQSVNDTFDYSCFPPLGYSGLVIVPRGNIYRRVNEAFSVTCYVDPSRHISLKDVTFTKGISSNVSLPQSQMLDNHSIQLNILEEKPVRYKLLCKDSEGISCMRQVSVGYPPLDVKNFKCVSFSWKRLECSYELQPNPVQEPNDNYYLSYFVSSKSVPGFKCTPNLMQRCCHLPGDECWRWGDSEDFPYDTHDQYLSFKLSSTNALGTESYTKVINQYAIMLPDPVMDLKIKSESSFDLVLTWRLPTFLKLFPPGIIYRIKYKTFEKERIVLEKIKVPWPGQTYTVAVSIRSGNNSWNVGDPEDEWWSLPVTGVVTTVPVPPWITPEVIPGGFHVVNEIPKNLRTITLYWKRTEDHLRGGPGFTYSVDVFTAKKRIDIKPIQLTENYSIFSNLSTNIPYTFHITPQNSAGKRNDTTATIEVHKTSQLPNDVKFPFAIYYPNEDMFYVRWFSGKNENTTKFTLFWCQDELNNNFEKDGPCKGNLSWKYLSNQTEANLTRASLGLKKHENKTIRFAISTQNIQGNITYSSGMGWTICPTANYDTEDSRKPPEVEIKDKNSSTAVIKWRLNCKNWMGNPSRIRVLWCEGKHNFTSNCSVQAFYQELADDTLKIENLKYNTIYSVWVQINFKDWNSELSQPLQFSTSKKVLSSRSIILLCSATVIAILTLIFILFSGQRQLQQFFKTCEAYIDVPDGVKEPVNTSHSAEREAHITDPSSEKETISNKEDPINTHPLHRVPSSDFNGFDSVDMSSGMASKVSPPDQDDTSNKDNDIHKFDKTLLSHFQCDGTNDGYVTHIVLEDISNSEQIPHKSRLYDQTLTKNYPKETISNKEDPINTHPLHRVPSSDFNGFDSVDMSSGMTSKVSLSDQDDTSNKDIDIHKFNKTLLSHVQCDGTNDGYVTHIVLEDISNSEQIPHKSRLYDQTLTKNYPKEMISNKEEPINTHPFHRVPSSDFNGFDSVDMSFGMASKVFLPDQDDTSNKDNDIHEFNKTLLSHFQCDGTNDGYVTHIVLEDISNSEQIPHKSQLYDQTLTKNYPNSENLSVDRPCQRMLHNGSENFLKLNCNNSNSNKYDTCATDFPRFIPSPKRGYILATTIRDEVLPQHDDLVNSTNDIKNNSGNNDFSFSSDYKSMPNGYIALPNIDKSVAVNTPSSKVAVDGCVEVVESYSGAQSFETIADLNASGGEDYVYESPPFINIQSISNGYVRVKSSPLSD